ncbi:hypothetical protein JZ751_028032 [Albula glossodonta]|uniref:Uncharacterized protein n=1 Tax=Albula glossodonta TaxID=121402 RepID=A0A8T2PAG1_9TELE|nr:hypothetical protein JZ751_028032 [Albula glossodonta]
MKSGGLQHVFLCPAANTVSPYHNAGGGDISKERTFKDPDVECTAMKIQIVHIEREEVEQRDEPADPGHGKMTVLTSNTEMKEGTWPADSPTHTVEHSGYSKLPLKHKPAACGRKRAEDTRATPASVAVTVTVFQEKGWDIIRAGDNSPLSRQAVKMSRRPAGAHNNQSPHLGSLRSTGVNQASAQLRLATNPFSKTPMMIGGRGGKKNASQVDEIDKSVLFTG